MSTKEKKAYVSKYTAGVKNNTDYNDVENNAFLSAISLMDWFPERGSYEGSRNGSPANRTVSHGKIKLALQGRQGTLQSRYAGVKSDFDNTVVERKVENSSGVAESKIDGAAVQSHSRNLNVQSVCRVCSHFRRRNIQPIPFHCCVEDKVTMGFRGPSPFGPIERPSKRGVQFEG
ncbi:hypothetical protein SUGI_0710660 [Cryptomeria japonica]|nr:hypothetical protein SUGI_0710660 [Cryptomeria japonica]